MFEEEENVIKVIRGNKATISVEIQDFSFNAEDKVFFKVFETSGLGKTPLINKEINVEEGKSNFDINLSGAETLIGEVINEPKEYWYEIDLNNDLSLLSYDDDGPKILILYPKGAVINAEKSITIKG